MSSIKIQCLPEGYKLIKGTPDASAFDIRSPVNFEVRKGVVTKVPLGIKSEIPKGMVGLIEPRSGLGSKGLHIANVAGVIDTDYRGEWMAKLTLADFAEDEAMYFDDGDRILQVAFVHICNELEYVDQLSDTERGAGSYGSSGVK